MFERWRIERLLWVESCFSRMTAFDPEQLVNNLVEMRYLNLA